MSGEPFAGRLVPRDPRMFDPFCERAAPLPPNTCPPPPGQAAAATDAPPPASAAVSSSHSCPPPRPWQDAAPGFGHTLAGAASVAFEVTLSPAVALILRLVEAAEPHRDRDEILARAIGVYAKKLGLPALARDGFSVLAPKAPDPADAADARSGLRPAAEDLADLPEFERVGKNRFRSE